MFSLDKEKNGEYHFVQDLVFGVELEMCVCDKDADDIRRCCDEYEEVKQSCCKDDKKYMKNFFTNFLTSFNDSEVSYSSRYNNKPTEYFRWFVTEDSSIHCNKDCRNNEKYHALELVSPILEYNNDGLEILHKMVGRLNDRFTFEVNNTQGLHVNMSYYGQRKDFDEGNLTLIFKFFKAWFNYEKQIISLLPPTRKRELADTAKPLNDEYRQGFREFEKKAGDIFKTIETAGVWPNKYLSVNLKKDRFEVRIAPPGMDIKNIENWTRLCLEFLKSSLNDEYFVDDLFVFINDDGKLKEYFDHLVVERYDEEKDLLDLSKNDDRTGGIFMDYMD
jgi:hypothetical protein